MTDLPVVWLSWLEHQRTTGLSNYFGHTVKIWKTSSRGALRYLSLGLRTTGWLLRHRPPIVIVQCPSIVLAHLVLMLKPLLGCRVVIDAHNEVLQNFNYRRSRLMAALYKGAVAWADLTIVTNPQLRELAESKGARAVVLPDIIECGLNVPDAQLSRPVRVVVISTFASDEPILEIVEAARVLGSDFEFTFTGRPNDLARSVEQIRPFNVQFAGFLESAEYWRLLRESSVIVDLTLKPACLVCGAYEAISVRRPVILSEDQQTKAWFGDAAVYTGNSRWSIAATVKHVVAGFDEVKRKQEVASGEIRMRWEKLARELQSALIGGTNGRR